MCACLKEHTRVDYVFYDLCMVFGSAVSWNRQDCNRQSIATSAKYFVSSYWCVFKCWDAEIRFWKELLPESYKPVIVVFFADFLMIRALLVKRYQIKLLKKVWYILLVLCG